MSFKITKLTIGKEKTEGDEKASQCTKRYYEVEIQILDEHEIEIAKASVEGLIDGLLTSPQQAREENVKASINLENIVWAKAEGVLDLMNARKT